MRISTINEEIYKLDDKSNISDGSHTFEELYFHRMILFSVICNQNPELAFKSKKHADGSMFDDYFICGIKSKEGLYTYHYRLKYWDYFKIKEVEQAPEWDGHKAEDVVRLLSLGEEDE